jgi:hypothetical protein
LEQAVVLAHLHQQVLKVQIPCFPQSHQTAAAAAQVEL